MIDAVRGTAIALRDAFSDLQSFRAIFTHCVYVGNVPLVAWKSFVIRKTRWGPRAPGARGNPEVLRITHDVQATNGTFPTETPDAFWLCRSEKASLDLT